MDIPRSSLRVKKKCKIVCVFCNQRLFRWWCAEMASSMPETSTRCSATSKSMTPLQSVSLRMMCLLLSLSVIEPFLHSDDCLPPPTDEKPASVENTFLLCPAPVVDEVGKYVSVTLPRAAWITFFPQTHVWICVFMATEHKKPAIHWLFYNPYPWPHSTSLIPSTAQQNARGSVAALANLPWFVLPLFRHGSTLLICHPIVFFITSDEDDISECLLQLLNIRYQHHLTRSLCLVPLWLWLPPVSVTPPYLPFICLSFNPHQPTLSGLLVQPLLIKARRQLAALSNVQFVSLQGGKPLRGKPLMFKLMKLV